MELYTISIQIRFGTISFYILFRERAYMHACMHTQVVVCGWRSEDTHSGNLFSPNMWVPGISHPQAWWQTPSPAGSYLQSRNNSKWHNINTLLGPTEGTRRCPGKSRTWTTRFLLLHSTPLPVLELHELLLTPPWFLKKWNNGLGESLC